MADAPAFEGWAIVELMGHRQRPGYVREVEMAGAKMLRVDIPAEPEPITEFYGASAIYSIRPAAEDIVKDWATRYGDTRPVRPVTYREPKRIAHDKPDDEPDFSEVDEDEEEEPF